MKMKMKRPVILILLLAFGAFLALGLGVLVFAQEEAAPEAGLSLGLKALGAGLAFGLAGLGTGVAQSRIGAAGMGAIAEDPGKLGVAIIMVAIPETVVILGFVIALIL